MMSENVLGIIPARGGSKRVAKKNIRKVGDKPLIAHAIDQAENAETIDRTVVSTEDEEIKDVAESHGGDVPFKRPEELATDIASTNEVVLHALDWFRERGELFDIVVTVQATTPFRTSDDIDGSVHKLTESDADSVVSISEFNVPPVWAVKEDKDGYLCSYVKEDYIWEEKVSRSQDTPKLYHPNGAVFTAHVTEFREQESFYTEQTMGYKMPRSRSLDIDEPFDLELAQALMQYKS